MSEPDPVDITPKIIEVASLALLENIKTQTTSHLAAFLQSLTDDVKNHLFPFTEANKERFGEGESGSLWRDFTHPFLHAACKYGNVGDVCLLLCSGVDARLCTEEEGTALDVATFHGRLDIVDKLLEWDPNMIEDEETVKCLLAKACRAGHPEMAKLWLDKLAEMKAEGERPCPEDFVAMNDPFIAACQGEQYELASFLVEEKVVTIGSETALRTGQKFSEVLRLWCKSEEEETGEFEELVAKWNNRQLHVFDRNWLDSSKTDLWHTLIKINLSHNSIKTIPEMLLWGLRHLERLDLSHNLITKLPEPKSMERLTGSRLMYLKVSHNKLHFPVIELFMLPLLEHLDLSNNDITSLNHKRFPSTLVKPEKGEIVWECSNLTSLNVSGNDILQIPESITAAKSLKNLCINNNRLAKLPSAWDCPLVKLNASANSIKEVPDMHGHWSRSLVVLNLSSNNLTEIPWTICQLTALHDLNLSSNLITQLPAPTDWSIYSLKELCLADNRLLHVENPGSPGISHKRKSFPLFKKKLSMEALTSGSPGSTFYSAGSFSEHAVLLSFPEVFEDSLSTLDLSDNQLQVIPPSVCNLYSLQKLDLSGNKGVTRLPDDLAQLRNLYYLGLKGLEIKEPETVAEVMKEEGIQTKSILNKLNERLLKCRPYYGMKLMLIGPERCGKSSLLACLTREESNNDDSGINIGSWTLHDPVKHKSSFRERLKSKTTIGTPSHQQKEIEFSTWDLKGGEMNCIIHQCFLTPRALYLLVWDVRDDLEGVEKLCPWLLSIQSRASSSIVIVVTTHIDKLRKSQDLEALRVEICKRYNRQDGFPEIAGILEVTATSPEGTGIGQLREFIYHSAVGMRIKKKTSGGSSTKVPFIGRMVPHTFFILKDIMANESERLRRCVPRLPPILKEAELANHIRKIPNNKIQSTQDIEEAAEFLSSCGSLVHFNDHLQGLNSLYFLDPVWLYVILSKVTNMKSALVREGRIHKTSLAALCVESGFGDNQIEEYLQLLQRLEILLPISRTEFLIPSRLPKEQPGQDLSPTLQDEKFLQTLERVYKLPYIPPGFWSRLVSRVYVSLKMLDTGGLAATKGGRSRRTPRRNSGMNQSIRVGVTLSRTNIMYWQQGIFVLHETGRIFLTPLTFKDSKPGICVRIHCLEGVFKPMGFMVDHIENLIKEWYPGLLDVDEFSGKNLIQRLIPCPDCTAAEIKRDKWQRSPLTGCEENIHYFSVGQLSLGATVGGSEEVECPRNPGVSLPLTRLIPDLLLLDLPIRALDKTLFDFDPKKSRRLGSGGFGEVFRAKFRGQNVAVKMLIGSTFLRQSTDSGLQSGGSQKSSVGSSCESDRGTPFSISSQRSGSNADFTAELVINGFANLRSEVATMAKLRHPCIIHLIGISIQHLCFAMELAPLGDLASFLKKELDNRREELNQKVYHTILDRTLTYKIALQVAHGVLYLHRKKIIYSDLKTDNVLLYSLSADASVNIKLTDYGIARHLDLQGARGMAGPMGFCAPEILCGKTFTEKVDWFSFSMLLYHLITGTWPYENLKSAIEVRSAVDTGIKPAFAYRDYTMVPMFPALERLMQRCWNDKPLERPSGNDIATVLRNASFVCLYNVIPLHTAGKITCLQTGNGQLHENSSRLWLWTGDGANRQNTKIHIKYYSDGELFQKQLNGSQANCMVQVGHSEFVGTKDNCIQLYGPPAVGPQLIGHQKDFRVDSEVLCLRYQPVNNKDIQGHLFAGLADGHVIVFNHTLLSSSAGSSANRPGMMWCRSKVLTMEKRQCNVLELVPEREEVWIACGNRLRILGTKVMLLEKQSITVTARAEHGILGLAHHHDNLFCIAEQSSRVLQYSMAGRQLVQVLQCGKVALQCGDCLVWSEDSKAAQEKEEEEVVVSPGRISFEMTETLQESKAESPPKDDEDNYISFRNSHFGGQHSATLSGASTLSSRSFLRPPMDIRRPSSDGSESHTSGVVFPQVQSLLTVKDTLWVGMNTGDTLVAFVDSVNCGRYDFGQLLAQLGPSHELGEQSGPVKQLLRAGEEYVVGCQEIQPARNADKSDTPCHYQLLVWQAWGADDIWNFDHIHEVLNDAVEAMEE
ncbi:leucine-rich repeat serine/threonine-protein kinase 1-like [Asterias amurensis]|uniref:leucine-rich repeat serine/threonine-protein kinase 1-like n=1 Tax=Asterias amurensis TaxID=7602 RepID=UPI003AB8F0BD